MSTIDRSISVKGELHSSEDIVIEGQLEGRLVCEDGCVVIAASCEMRGDVLARDITVFGSHTGQLIATDVVDIRPAGSVTGQVISKRLILDPEARLQGRVEPQHLEAALHVARYQQKKRDAAEQSLMKAPQRPLA